MRGPTIYGGIAALALALDQWVKHAVETGMAVGQPIDLLPFLALYRTHNTGISFSWLAGTPVWMLIAVIISVTLFIGWLGFRSEPRQVFARAGFALIVAGALGNLVDRIAYGHVVDYILFHTQSWSFAVFNLADAFISVGAALVILQELVDWRRPDARSPETDTNTDR